jgi:HEAT repeat protein
LAVVAALLGCSLAGISSARAAGGRPDLTHLLGRARLVVIGDVADVTSYDAARFTVARVAVGKVLSGKLDTGQVLVVERHDLPSSPQLLQAGQRAVVFLIPARRNSSLEKALPAATYYEVISPPTGAISDSTASSIDEAAAILERLIAIHRKPEKDATRRAASIRALVFDEIAARHPTVVADGARGIGRIDDLATTLTDDERTRLAAVLRRTDLPTWIRVALVDAIADRQLTALIPELRKLKEPDAELQRAAWDALQRLGAAPSLDDLQPALTSSDPATRAATVDALVAAKGTNARPQLEQLATKDADRDVRLAAIEALGKTGPQALPTLERSFASSDWGERRMAGRAIATVGGRPAQETLARLAFEGPPDGQKLAVTLLFLTGISHDDPLVKRIEEKHPDESVRHIVESGLEVHDH